MPRRPQLILCDILSEAVQAAVILQIRMFDDIRRERIFRIDLFHDPVRKEHIAVITGIPVNDIPDLFCPIFLCPLKTIVHFDKQFTEDRQVIHPVLKSIRDPGPHLSI